MQGDIKSPVFTWKKDSNTALERFKKVLEDKHKTRFDSYWELHNWTIKNYTKFWEEVWHFIDIVASKPYDEIFVKTGPGFLDNMWFRGAELNYAENLLRIRDDGVALICVDELGHEEYITYAEMFEEVKLYAAAFRKNGLKKGDSVACFLPNRKEAIFAMLATTSIGAVWGAVLPLYGAWAAASQFALMDPKFLIAVDSHQYNGVLQKTLDHLSFIIKTVSTIKKVILVVNDIETFNEDLSSICNCVFLKSFLKEGPNPDGIIPDIQFEQCSINDPVSVSYTSGTTGQPKGVVHSAATLISRLRDFVIHFDFKRENIIYIGCMPGWTDWEYIVCSLALGVKLLLHCGSAYYKINGMNFWDFLDKYGVTYIYPVATSIDYLEKMQLFPSPKSKLNKLKFIMIGGTPATNKNLEYLREVKQNAYICSVYGATELLGDLSSFHVNMPVYGREIQIPSLGIDIQCFDKDGKSVIGQRGELVVCTPAPNFPIGLIKDENSEVLTKTYLSKYPGVWCQNDECWINPKTNGVIIFGRSDDIFIQNGVRFSTSDIYNAIHTIEELQDYICVSQEYYHGGTRVILFIKMKTDYTFTPCFRAKIEKTISDELFQMCIPDVIVEVPDIPVS